MSTKHNITCLAEAMQLALADLTSIQTKYFAVSEKLAQHTQKRLSKPVTLNSSPFAKNFDFRRSPPGLPSRRVSPSGVTGFSSQHRDGHAKNITWWSTPPKADETKSGTTSVRDGLLEIGKRQSASAHTRDGPTGSPAKTSTGRAGR